VPWAAITVLYSAFSACSYRDLIDAGPRLAAALRRAGRLPAPGSYRDAGAGAGPGGQAAGASSRLGTPFARA
jgi:hypothetical protein